MSLHDHLVVTKLLGNITSRGSGDFDPGLTEQGTGGQDESQVKDGVERIINDLGKRRGRRDVVRNSSNRDLLSSLSFRLLPLSKKSNQNIGWGSVVQELRDKVQVGDKGSLQDDGHVGCVEKLDGVCSLLSSILLVLDRKIDSPSLEVDDNDKDQNGCQQVCQVRQVLTVESLTKSANLVVTSDEKVEKSNDSTFKLSSSPSVNSGWAEGLPDYGLANVGGNKERNTRPQTVPLLEKFVEGKDNQTSAKELSNDQKSITSTDRTKISVHSTDNISNGFAGGDQDTK